LNDVLDTAFKGAKIGIEQMEVIGQTLVILGWLVKVVDSDQSQRHSEFNGYVKERYRTGHKIPSAWGPAVQDIILPFDSHKILSNSHILDVLNSFFEVNVTS
jgi:hypothetical protein